MADRHLYRCPSCGLVTRAHPTSAGTMRCSSCGRTFGAEACRLRPETPPPSGPREGFHVVRVRRDALHERAARSYQGTKAYFRDFRDNLERSIGRSPIERMENERNERLGRIAGALVRGARPACLR